MSFDVKTQVDPTDMDSRTVVSKVTTDMIILDLANGLDRGAIANKYAYVDGDTGLTQPFEKWMVDLMFNDPHLKGRKPAKIKRLPFEFAGTTAADGRTYVPDNTGRQVIRTVEDTTTTPAVSDPVTADPTDDSRDTQEVPEEQPYQVEG